MMTGTFDLGRVTGFSAYEVWKAQPGNENKTEQDFLKFISSGGDWINFDTTPIDLKTVRDYKTYGSVKNLMDSDNLQDDGFVEMIEIINIYSDSDDATFSFESVSTPNNVLTGPDSPIYDVIQTLSVFTNAKSYKFVRRAQFNDSSKEVFITHAWECWEENGAAHKLADLFSITIGDVTKKTDGTNDVEFTKEELELGNDWINFNESPFQLDEAKDCKAYGLLTWPQPDFELDLNSQLDDVIMQLDDLNINTYDENTTFTFESRTTPNTDMTNSSSDTVFDVVQILTLMNLELHNNEISAKFIRYGKITNNVASYPNDAWKMCELDGRSPLRGINVMIDGDDLGANVDEYDGNIDIDISRYLLLEALKIDNVEDFAKTPVDFDKIGSGTYRTYGLTGFLDTDLTRDSVPDDALSVEYSDGTFLFESKGFKNTVTDDIYNADNVTIQTMILFAGSESSTFAKYVRYGIFNDATLILNVLSDWTRTDQFDNNEHVVSAAYKLANTFNLKIAGVTKPVDGSKTVEFTKEELGLDGGSSGGYFENIFSGYSSSVSVKIGVSVHEAQLESPRLKGDVFLIQLAPTIVKTENFGKKWIDASDSEETFTPNGEVADYSTLLLVSTMNITNERNLPGGYQSYNNYNYDHGGLYNAVVKTEKLISLNGSTYRDVSNGTFITVKVQVDNSGVAWFDAIKPIGMPVYITNIWRLK